MSGGIRMVGRWVMWRGARVPVRVKLVPVEGTCAGCGCRRADLHDQECPSVEPDRQHVNCGQLKRVLNERGPKRQVVSW